MKYVDSIDDDISEFKKFIITEYYENSFKDYIVNKPLDVKMLLFYQYLKAL